MFSKLQVYFYLLNLYLLIRFIHPQTTTTTNTLEETSLPETSVILKQTITGATTTTTNTIPKTARIVRIGNAIDSVNRYKIDTEANHFTFLLNNLALMDGVLFAFSAFVLNTNKFYFQIWRPINQANNNNKNATGTSSQFKLIDQLAYRPYEGEEREDVYFLSNFNSDCLQLRKDDRIGIYLPELPYPIAYFFRPGEKSYHSDPKGQTVKDNIGQMKTFDLLPLPYGFFVSAYIDTNFTHYEQSARVASDGDVHYMKCRPDVLIPPEPVVTLPPTSTITPKMGPMGATGSMGGSGDVGNIGDKGATGNMGIRGNKGPDGDTGMIGEQGGMGANGTAVPAAIISEQDTMKYQSIIIIVIACFLFLIAILIVLVVCWKRAHKTAKEEYDYFRNYPQDINKSRSSSIQNIEEIKTYN